MVPPVHSRVPKNFQQNFAQTVLEFFTISHGIRCKSLGEIMCDCADCIENTVRRNNLTLTYSSASGYDELRSTVESTSGEMVLFSNTDHAKL